MKSSTNRAPWANTRFTLLLTLMLFALGIGNAWAAEVNFGYSNWDGVSESFSGTEKDEVIQTVDGVVVTYTRNGSSLYANSTAIRVYKSNTLKFEAPAGSSITSISFDGTKFLADVTTDVNTCTATGSALTWEGNATSVTFTRPSNASSYAQLTKAIVTLSSSSGEGEGEGEGGETPESGSQQTITIRYNSTFSPALPTTSGSVNSTSTAHTVEGISVKEQGIYKGSSSNYLMFAQNKGFLYNTESLGTITSVSVTYTSGTSTSGQAGVYFGSTEQSSRTTTSNKTIKGQSETETWTNTTEGNGFFQLSTSNKNVQITEIVITYTADAGGGETPDPSVVATPVISGTDNFYNSTEVSITCTTTAASIYYTLDDTEPTTSSTLYSAPFPLNETKTVKAIAVKAEMTNSAVAKKTFTKATVLTVAEALTAIDNGGDLTNKYVKGTISQIKEYNPTYSSIYYYISDDGTKTNELYVYSGKGLNSANFSAVTDLTVGDDVIICGTLKEYNGVKEFDYNNYLVYHKPIAQLSWSSSTCAAEIDAVNEFPTLTKTNDIAVSYSSSNTAAATINEKTGEITLVAEGETIITATFTGNENYKANSASYTLNVKAAVVRGTITYNTNGGTEVETQEDQTNLPETLPTTTKAGYNFGGWYTDAECNTPAVPNALLTGDITLHAKWLEPYTVAQALAMDETTGVYVKGIISTITEVSTEHGDATYRISDNGTTTSEMIVYRGKNVGNKDFTSEDEIAVGDIVVIYGNLSEYNDAIQLAQGNYIYSLTEPTLYTVTISFETNGGETVASIEANTLPDPLPITTKEGHAFDGWYMDNALTIPAVAGTPITTDADITLYAKWIEVSQWATTYTSNIEVGGNQYSVIIGGITYENQSQRYGTGSIAGYATLYLPAETETLHFHAAGWNSEDVTITAKIGEEILGTFELKRDEGISGNSTTYTLQGNTSTEQYFYIDLTSYTIAANTAITFEATTGKRFLLYGVNQEGGITPELNRIEITGEATTLTYEIGDVFDPAGLGVNAIYTLAGVDHETVAVDEADVEWSFNPATIAAETSQVEVTATYMEKTATKTVTGLTVNVPTPEITATPASIDWGTVNKDSEASREVSVTLKAVANATISISGTNPEVFSVDKTALTETGTIVVSANTSSVGSFTATITISDDAEVAEAEKISLKIVVEGTDDVDGNWQLVTDAATLKAGDQVIIASVEVDEKYYTMGKQNTNNRGAVESAVSGTQLTPAPGTSVLTLVDAGDDKFAFQASNGNYLYAASSSSNYMRTKAELDDNGRWSITISEGTTTIQAQGDYTRNTMQYNQSSNLFSCYASASQQAICLYRRTPNYTRTVTPGNYGTICLPNNMAHVLGATLYEVAGKEGNKLVFDEVLVSETKAGVPYIFKAEAATIEVFYGAETGAAQMINSLQGTFEYITDGEEGKVGNILEGNYVLYNNFIKKCGARCKLPENRAYFVTTDLENLTPAPLPLPGRKRVSMGVEGENSATGLDNITENGAIAPAMQGTYDIMGRKLAEPTTSGFYIINGKKVFVVK